ncbi:MAG: protein BatD [Bacteroidaceae bacterium]|nr:protein BatD [Bacteroidaceae bacterium]
MKRIFLTTLLFLIFLGNVSADEITFVAQAPKSVVVNQQFRLTFKVNKANVKEPTIPDLSDFNILTGPHRSTQQSYQSINGKMTKEESVTFTYILLAEKEGEFKIPAASVMVDGKKYSSNPLRVKVLPPDQNSSAQSQGGGSYSQSGSSSATNISDEDLFVKATLSMGKVYEQEAVLLTYKVYSTVNLTNLSNPTPDLKGFHIQEVQLPREKHFDLEHYNGRNYQTLIWRQFVLFPQQSGELEIPSLTFEGVVAVQSRRNLDPFEMMFNGGPSYFEVKKNLSSNKLTLDVKKLPADRPVGFSGGVGQFSISSSISAQEAKTNEELTLKVKVKGIGNMKLVGNPIIDFPSEFEVYDPIINNNFSLKTNGFSGEKVYEYVVTPRASGSYTIPAARFIYFDPLSDSYKTIESESYTVTVEKGKEQALPAATYVGKETSKVLASDIRHIKLGDVKKQGGKSVFFASTAYCLLYIIPLLLFVAYIIVYRKRVVENANISLVRTKKANKVAVKRLKIAKRLLSEGKKNEFYDEILKTLWGYMSDKMNIPVSQLSKDNVANELEKRGADSALIKDLNEVLNEAEFARYAPGDASQAMDKVYSMAMDVIDKMENSIKK